MLQKCLVTDGNYIEGEHRVMYRIVESICCTPKSENIVKMINFTLYFTTMFLSGDVKKKYFLKQKLMEFVARPPLQEMLKVKRKKERKRNAKSFQRRKTI